MKIINRRWNLMAMIFSLLLASLVHAGNLDGLLPFLGNKEIDIIHYGVNAQIKEMPPRQIEFETEIELKTLAATQRIDLHIEASVLESKTIFFEGQPLRFNILPGIPNSYGLSGSVLEILLPREIAAGETLKLKLNYFVQKSDWAADDMGIFYVPKENNYGQDILITRNWPYYGRFWLPSNDSPEDVAEVSYKISVPSNYKVAANGKLLRGDEHSGSGLLANGLRLFEWEQKMPTTVYNFAFAVGNFDIEKKRICFRDDGKVNDKSVGCIFADQKIPSVLYYNKNHPDSALLKYQIEKANSSAIYFSKLFGSYVFEKIGFVHSPYPFAMESTSMIVLNVPSAAVHEIVHHWWGNNVHISHWGDFWISEGFTTYFTGVFDEYKSGTNTSCLKNPADPLNFNENTDPNSIFNDTPYCKGAFALHNLRVRITNLGGIQPSATQVFFELMKRLYSTHSTKQLSTPELVNFVEKNLVNVMQSKGITVTQTQVTQLVNRWKTAWFVSTLVQSYLPVPMK